MTEALTDEEVRALGAEGFFIRQTWLGPVRAAVLHERVQTRLQQGGLQPAAIRRGADRRVDTQTRGDSTTWLTAAEAPEAWAHFEALGEALSQGAYLGLGRFDLQLACYPGGGAAYARHRDAFPGAANRRVTALYYLNQNWEPAHGGELLLHTSGGPVEHAPVLDSLVVFLSEQVEHEVLPTHAPRLALTAWYYGR